MDMQRANIAKETVKMKNKVGELVLSHLKNHYKVVVVGIM